MKKKSYSSTHAQKDTTVALFYRKFLNYLHIISLPGEGNYTANASLLNISYCKWRRINLNKQLLKKLIFCTTISISIQPATLEHDIKFLKVGPDWIKFNRNFKSKCYQENLF